MRVPLAPLPVDREADIPDDAVMDRFAALGAMSAVPEPEDAWTQEEILFQLRAAELAVQRVATQLDEAVAWRAQLVRAALAAGLSPADALRAERRLVG